MKRCLLLILTCMCISTISAQIDTLDKQSGCLFKFEEYPIVSYTGSLILKVILSQDVQTNRKLAILQVTVISTSLGSPDVGSASLSKEEIEECIKALEYIRDNEISKKPTVYTTFTYKSKKNFYIEVIYTARKEWIVEIQARKNLSTPSTQFDINEINDIIGHLSTAHKVITNLEEGKPVTLDAETSKKKKDAKKSKFDIK